MKMKQYSLSFGSIAYCAVSFGCFLSSHSVTSSHSTNVFISEASPSQIAQWTPPFSLLNDILATAFPEQVSNDDDILDIASFEWGTSDQGVETPFILCVEQGRQGVVELMSHIRHDHATPLWSRSRLTCFMVHTTPELAVELPSKVQSIRHLMPYSSIFNIPEGMIRYVSDGAYLADVKNCQSGVRLLTPLFFQAHDALLNIIRSDLEDVQRFKDRLMSKFYWLGRSTTTTTSDQCPWGSVWRKSVEEVVNGNCACDFSKVDVAQEEDMSFLRLSNLCHLNNDAGCASHCMLSLLAYVSTLPDIYQVENVETPEPTNLIGGSIVQSGMSRTKPYPLWEAGLNGTGIIVQVVDSDIDVKHCFFQDPNRSPVPYSTYQTPVTDLNQRKVVQNVKPSTYPKYPLGQHGTHVSGIVGGHALDQVVGTYNNGIAFGCKLAFYGGFAYPTNLSLIYQPAYEIGARITTNSWNFQNNAYTANPYLTDALRADEYMYKNDDFIVMHSASNNGESGQGTRTIGSPGNSKNGMAIGASQNSRIVSGVETANITRMADFSSIGPGPKNRMLPTVVAPGSLVTSANVNSSCGVVALQGTSMACPVAAAVMTLVLEYFREGYYPTGVRSANDPIAKPSSALLKAVLINSGTPLVAYANIRPEQKGPAFNIPGPPSIYQGWGRIQANRVLRLNNATYPILYIQDRKPIAEDEIHTFKFTIPASSTVMSEFYATIVWTDPPTSTTAGGQIVHDIDLTATLDSDPRRQTVYPNNMRGPDRTNNIEKIVIPKPIPNDVFTMKIKGTDISLTPVQNYAMVVSGVYVPAAWYCQDPRTIRPDSLYRTENCRRACQANKRNPICCPADAGDTCLLSQANEALCTTLTKPLNC